ncbi:MAG: (d)CMP kinase [Planctomycetes bacterium]|nr:(d)CMP kinase [Planctomycetota bacterium]
MITIDGPAGSGKSTVAALLAKRLGLNYLDTGAMYRAVTWAALEQNVDLDDVQALIDLTRLCHIEVSFGDNPDQIKINGQVVTDVIRAPNVTEQAYKIARIPEIRRIMVQRQREIAGQSPGIVTEGRDQGTVVFADADCKFYLDADAECRALRRWLQLKDTPTGKGSSYPEILAAQQQRDQRDKNRSVSPLKVPQNARIIDTTSMTIDQVVKSLYQHITEENS